jgi:hypothetical protein
MKKIIVCLLSGVIGFVVAGLAYDHLFCETVMVPMAVTLDTAKYTIIRVEAVTDSPVPFPLKKIYYRVK